MIEPFPKLAILFAGFEELVLVGFVFCLLVIVVSYYALIFCLIIKK